MKKKSFWARPEGITCVLFLGGIGALIYGILPYIADYLRTTVGVGVLLVILAAIVYVLIDSKLRASFWRSFQNDMRTLTGFFIKIENLSSATVFLKKLEALIPQLEQLVNVIQQQKQTLSDLNEMYQIKSGKEITLKPQKAGSQPRPLKASEADKRLDNLYKLLFGMGENSVMLYKETKTAFEDEGIVAVEEEAVAKVEELETVMELTTTFVQSINPNEKSYNAEAWLALEKWQKETNSPLLGEAKAQILAGKPATHPTPKENPTQNPQTNPTSDPNISDSDNKYRNLFKF